MQCVIGVVVEQVFCIVECYYVVGFEYGDMVIQVFGFFQIMCGQNDSVVVFIEVVDELLQGLV